MTVKELIEVLESLPPTAVVFEECGSEHIPLRREDLKMVSTVFNSESGEVEQGEFLVLEGWS